MLALFLRKRSFSVLPVLLYLYVFSGRVRGFSGQIRKVEGDDVVETLVSMYVICTVSCIFSSEA